MPVGDVEALAYKNPLAIILAKAFGAKGLHDHLRIAPMVDYARNHLLGRDIAAVEVGCGEGLCLFELAKILGNRMTAVGYDFDPDDIARGRQIADARFPQIQLHCLDATQVVNDGQKFDVILLMDFLEHVQNPASIVSNLSPSLRVGGQVFVSVPTPRYPVVFTREMHERIGHVVDGYTEEMLRSIFPRDFELSYIVRNTGTPAQYGCWLQARIPRLPYTLDWLKNIALTSLFRKLDWFNGPKSCSLFAVFTKVTY